MVSYREVLAERFDYKGLLAELTAPPPPPQTYAPQKPAARRPVCAPTRKEKSGPYVVDHSTRTTDSCPARRHNTSWSWTNLGCICRDPEKYAAFKSMQRAAKTKRSFRLPDLRKADQLVAEQLADGYSMPAATKSDRRLAAVLLRRRGKSFTTIAGQLHMSQQTVIRWTANTAHMSFDRRSRVPQMR